MRKFFEILICIVFIGALTMAGSQYEDGSCNYILTLFCLGIAALCAILWDWFFPDEVHITDEIYDDLRKQLEDWANDNENGTYNKKFVFSTDEATVNIEAELYKHNSKSKFHDEAWGSIKTCTEYNTYYRIAINDWVVTNRFGSEVDSDFDPEMVEMEVDGCTWE